MQLGEKKAAASPSCTRHGTLNMLRHSLDKIRYSFGTCMDGVLRASAGFEPAGKLDNQTWPHQAFDGSHSVVGV